MYDLNFDCFLLPSPNVSFDKYFHPSDFKSIMIISVCFCLFWLIFTWNKQTKNYQLYLTLSISKHVGLYSTMFTFAFTRDKFVSIYYVICINENNSMGIKIFFFTVCECVAFRDFSLMFDRAFVFLVSSLVFFFFSFI